MAGLYQFTVQLNDKVSDSAKHAGEGMKGLAETFGAVKDAVVTGIAGVSNAMSAIGKGDFGEAFQSLSESLAGTAKLLDMVVPGLGEAVSALIEVGGLVGGIAIGIVEKGAELALEASEATEKMSAMFEALGGGKVAGDQVIDMLDNLSSQVGLTRTQLAPLAKEFMAMGVRDLPALQKQLTAAASAQALMGEEGGAAYVNLSKKIQNAIEAGGKLKLSSKALGSQLSAVGLDLDDVAAAMGTTGPKLAAALKSGTVDAQKFGDAMQKALIDKGAGPLAKMASSFDFLKASFMENISKLFEDVDVTPFTDALKNLVGIFSQNTASGKTLKTVITGFFNAVFKAAAFVIPYIKKAFYELIIAGLKIYIALKPITKWFEESGAKAKVLTVIQWMFKNVSKEIWGFGDMVARGIGLIVTLGKAAGHAWDEIKEFVTGAATAAEDFISGLVNGIKSGTGLVIDAVRALGKGAVGALKGLLGISSPSKVMESLGDYSAQGFAAGVTGGTDEVTSSAQGLGKAVAQGAVQSTPARGFSAGSFAPMAATSAPTSGSSSQGSQISVTAEFNFNGAVEGAQELTEQAVSVIFERIALQQGL
jgi:hypothetical protein